MTSTNAVVVEATTDPNDVGPLAEVIAQAFINLPPSRWLVPDHQDRTATFPDFFALYVEHGVHAGEVHTTPDRNAVAIWFKGTPPPPVDHYARLAAITGSQNFHRFTGFDHALDSRHPALLHHWLAIIAVAPGMQRRGVGTALLNHYHAFLDRAGRHAYLEAADLDSRDLYRRLGYRDHGDPIVLPESGPPLYPMWRNPQPTYDYRP